jgi:hypothetical protein
VPNRLPTEAFQRRVAQIEPKREASLRANQGLQLAGQCSALRHGKKLAFVPAMS